MFPSSAAAATHRLKTGRAELAPVAVWLFVCCALIFLMVVVGGVTRLTLSGLSITEWRPIIGVVPPLSAAEWADAFAKYRAIPEYRLIHSGMSLAEFKSIYFWEYAHRLLGRLIGVAFALPFAWFWARGRLPRRLAWPLAAILLLGLAQGALGWYMVKSGLADRTEVSQYRLVAHLLLALALYAAILWTALGLVRRPLSHDVGAGWRRAAEAMIALVALTIAAGGFVAGTRAGLIYNTFPLMDGRLIPAGYAQLQPFYLNWFETISAIQFNHRLLAMTTVGRGAPGGGRRLALSTPVSRPHGAVGAFRRRRPSGGPRRLDLDFSRADPARRRASGRRRIAADRRDRFPPHAGTCQQAASGVISASRPCREGRYRNDH